MIRNHHNKLEGTPARRLAVIRLPRPQRARMGSIGNGQPARDTTTAWTTIQDETPDSSANWMSYVLMEQARARETTPGSLTYTPASDHPAPNIAPWNNWLSPNCPAGQPAADLPTSGSDFRKLFLVFGAIGAAAALTYMVNSAERSR